MADVITTPNSILTSIKSLLGIDEEYTHFDGDIIMHINSVFFVLNQIGVTPEKIFSIKDKTAVWEDYTLTNLNLEPIKSYMYLKVRLLFDPPLSNALIDVMKTQVSELEWRIMVSVDPAPIVIPPITYDEEVVTW